MAKKVNLDRIDMKILDALRQNGRLSYQKLSELVNLTPRPCLERVRNLEKLGIIGGYQAIIHLPTPDYTFFVQAQITLADHSQSQSAFTQEILQQDEVVDCWLVSGTFDFLVRIACRDMEHYRLLAEGWLTSNKFSIEKIVTTIELQVLKQSHHPRLAG